MIKTHFIFDPVQKRVTNLNFTGCQMQHFVIVLIPYVSLLDLSLFSPLWFKPRSGHMWESQVLLTDGQVVFLRVLRFSPTFDERLARYK